MSRRPGIKMRARVGRRAVGFHADGDGRAWELAPPDITIEVPLTLDLEADMPGSHLDGVSSDDSWADYNDGAPQYRDQRDEVQEQRAVLKTEIAAPRQSRSIRFLEGVRLLCHGETRVTVELITKSLREDLAENPSLNRWLIRWKVAQALCLVAWDGVARLLRGMPGRPAGG